MSDEQTNGAATEAESGKEAIYLQIRDMVKAKTTKNIGKSGARELFDLVVQAIFVTATKEGTIRLNGGFGSFHKRHYTSGERRLPSGQNVQFGERDKLRYEEGVVVKALVDNGGDLNEALKARGSRTSEAEEGEAQAAPATTVAPEVAAKANARVRGKQPQPAAVELD